VAAIRGLRPQDTVELQYLRDDKPRTVTVTLKAGDSQLLATYAPAMG
jgi:S1-C subfamily serine protease